MMKGKAIRPKALPEQACRAEMSRHILPGGGRMGKIHRLSEQERVTRLAKI